MSYIIHIQKPPFQMTISAPSSAKHCLFLHHCHMQLGTSSSGWKASDVQGHRQLAWFNARAAITKSIFLPSSTNATLNLPSRAWGPAQLLEPASALTQVAAKETASISSICLPMETTYLLLRRKYPALRPKAQTFSQWQKQWCSSQKGKAEQQNRVQSAWRDVNGNTWAQIKLWIWIKAFVSFIGTQKKQKELCSRLLAVREAFVQWQAAATEWQTQHTQRLPAPSGTRTSEVGTFLFQPVYGTH